MMEQNFINEQVTGFEDEQDKIDSEEDKIDDKAEFSVPGEMMGLQPYQFEPVIDIDIKNAPDGSGEESSEEENERRLENLEW